MLTVKFSVLPWTFFNTNDAQITQQVILKVRLMMAKYSTKGIRIKIQKRCEHSLFVRRNSGTKGSINEGNCNYLARPSLYSDHERVPSDG